MNATKDNFLYHIEVKGTRIATYVNKGTANYWYDLRRRVFGHGVALIQESHIGFIKLKSC